MRRILFYALGFILTLACLLAVFGGLVYRFYSLNFKGVVASLVLTSISFVIIQYFRFFASKNYRQAARIREEKSGLKAAYFLLPAAYILLIFFCFYILFKHQTDSAIISPWQAVPAYFFLFYFLATAALLANAVYARKIALPLIMLHYFLSFSMAAVVYKLGYGYDPFIHQATESLIDKTGAVFPKTFYYLGQYGLIVTLHKITGLSIVWLDRLLVPALAALSLPYVLWRNLKNWFSGQEFIPIIVISLLTLSFSFLIVTTPQNLAYLFLLLALIYGLCCKNIYDYLLILLLSLAAAITQPVAGIPALLFSGMLAVYYSDGLKMKKIYYGAIIAAAVLILPTLFFFLNKNLPSAGESGPVPAAASLLSLDFAGRENIFLNFAYLYAFNFKFIIGFLALAGIALAWKFKEQCRVSFIYLAMSLAMLGSYVLSLKLPFSFLISYEQSDFPDRLLLIAAMFLIPFYLMAFYAVLEKIMVKSRFIKISFAAFLVLLICASLFSSYPRYDNYFNSRGYAVSAADIAAVGWIDSDSASDYIVLSNQQVGAAALSRFGFKKYYSTSSGPVFYYPIPTSSPLYGYYLDMVYKKPSRETMLSAMSLAGVRQGYFVLDKYWFGFKKILDEAEFSASSWREFGGGEVYVFKYLK